MGNGSTKDKVAFGKADPQDEQVQKEVAEEQEVHQEAAQRRTAGPYSDFDSIEDAEKDLEEKRQRLAEAIVETQAAEQSLPDLKIALQQKKVDELKEQGVQYDDEGRQLGILGSPVSNPLMYGGNPAPDTLGTVH